jgi:hypothetical protein
MGIDQIYTGAQHIIITGSGHLPLRPRLLADAKDNCW